MTDSEKAEAGPSFDIKSFLKGLTRLPGIYKMFNSQGDIIYIGKAKNLKNRVSSYFRTQSTSPKQLAMVSKISSIEVVITHTEGEALLLESQLIKRYKPRYNICLRDDKSYPYIYISTDQDFPQITFHRGAKNKPGQYFGPYPSAGAVRETLKILQKIFPIRQCEDSYFKNRSRPCLQYQIERCSGPCVGLVSRSDYSQELAKTLLFLEGKGHLLIDQLIIQMEQASAQLNFENAARIRDQIALLRTVLEKHFVHGEKGDVDIVVCATQSTLACVQVLFIRGGQHLGHKIFFPKMSVENTESEVLEAFITQFYLDKKIPYEIFLSHELPQQDLNMTVLSEQAKHAVVISTRLRGDRLKWLKMAQTNTEHALLGRISNKQSLFNRFVSLQEEFDLAEIPKRLECFDISHTQGDYTVASCVVFDREGPVKSAYRRFNIEGITKSDDYAAIHQAVYRRFKRLNKGEHEAPEILFIDGGIGQVNAAEKALDELSINNVIILGVSKGVDRKAGMEKIISAGENLPLDINPNASALLLIQNIRDEAHRFAITGHRLRRGKTKKQSVLESIDGLGPKRRQLLLKQFGGLQGIAKAGVDALCSINGISYQLAQRIYDTFHQDHG